MSRMFPSSAGAGVDSGGGTRSLLAHDRLLGQRLFLHAMARFVVAAAIVAGALIARYLVGVDELDVFALVLLAISIAFYNVCILVLIGPTRDEGQAVRRFRLRRLLVHASIVLDFFALTAALWFVGGARSPFLAFYLFHIAIASILLSRRAAFLAALLAAVMLAGLVLVEVTGMLPPPTPAGAIPGAGAMDARYVATVLVVYLSLFALIVLSQTHLAESLRHAERAMQERAVQLEKLSGMRRDFLMVALHDVSAPIGAAAMLLRNLRDGLLGSLEGRQKEQVERALVKLEGLEHLVRDLRILGELDTTDLGAHSTEISLSFLLADVVDENTDEAREKGVLLEAEASDQAALVFGVPRLLREAIANYVTNAIKYTPPGGRVVARVRPENGRFRVEVSDTGIGITSDDQARLFEEFVRVGRGHPDLKRVHGTGLGLSIVRRIAEAHRGRVGVDSAPDRGSTFWIELPACTGDEDSGGARSAPGADEATGARGLGPPHRN